MRMIITAVIETAKMHLRANLMQRVVHCLDEGIVRGKLVLNLFVYSRPMNRCNGNAIIISLLLYN